MKLSITALSLGTILVAATAGAQVPADTQPVSGSESAAVFASREYLALLYDTPGEKISGKVVSPQGNSATVKATMPTRACDLSLMKNPNANKHGWVVQTHSCRVL